MSRIVRRQLMGLCLAALGIAFPCPAAEPPKTDKVDTAVARAVGFLLTQQDLKEGSFNDRTRESNSNAMTALAIMAMASVGHLPTDMTKEGEAVRRGIDFLVRADRQTPDGYFGAKDGSRMYGHGITTLALTEMLGMGVDRAQEKLLRERCQKAIELILRSQKVKKYDRKFDGGWRYAPDSGDSDLSASVWQLMALRSAKNAGLTVPKEAIDAAVAYLKRSYYSARDAEGRPTNLKSGCAYMPGNSPEYATAAAGLLSLQVCGEYETPEVIGSAEWLREKTESNPATRTRKLDANHQWFFYGTYYYAQGMQKRGGEYAREAREFTEQTLLARQNAEGSWVGNNQELGAGRVYSTSLAVLSLSVKYHYLPIYQH